MFTLKFLDSAGHAIAGRVFDGVGGQGDGVAAVIGRVPASAGRGNVYVAVMTERWLRRTC